MRSRCHHDTNEMPAEYASQEFFVNVSHSRQPFKSAITQMRDNALRAGAVNARSRVMTTARSARSAEALDRDEHSATIPYVMADMSRYMSACMSRDLTFSFRRHCRRQFP